MYLKMGKDTPTTRLVEVGRVRLTVAVLTLRAPPPIVLCVRVASPRLSVCLRADHPLARRRTLRPAAALAAGVRRTGNPQWRTLTRHAGLGLRGRLASS